MKKVGQGGEESHLSFPSYERKRVLALCDIKHGGGFGTVVGPNRLLAFLGRLGEKQKKGAYVGGVGAGRQRGGDQLGGLARVRENPGCGAGGESGSRRHRGPLQSLEEILTRLFSCPWKTLTHDRRYKTLLRDPGRKGKKTEKVLKKQGVMEKDPVEGKPNGVSGDRFKKAEGGENYYLTRR